MTMPRLNPELVSVLRRLRPGGLLKTLPERLKLAHVHHTPYQDVLLMLLRNKIARRDRGAAHRRAQQGGRTTTTGWLIYRCLCPQLSRKPLNPCLSRRA